MRDELLWPAFEFTHSDAQVYLIAACSENKLPNSNERLPPVAQANDPSPLRGILRAAGLSLRRKGSALGEVAGWARIYISWGGRGGEGGEGRGRGGSPNKPYWAPSPSPPSPPSPHEYQGTSRTMLGGPSETMFVLPCHVWQQRCWQACAVFVGWMTSPQCCHRSNVMAHT